MKWEKRVKVSAADREVAALRREGEQYAAAGMIERLALVNTQLQARGADPIPVPKGTDAPAARQTRKSTEASTRRRSDT